MGDGEIPEAANGRGNGGLRPLRDGILLSRYFGNSCEQIQYELRHLLQPLKPSAISIYRTVKGGVQAPLFFMTGSPPLSQQPGCVERFPLCVGEQSRAVGRSARPSWERAVQGLRILHFPSSPPTPTKPPVQGPASTYLIPKPSPPGAC